MNGYDTSNAQLYDDFYALFTEDLPFFVDEAKKVNGPILEIGCGTGRVLIPLAEAGVQVVGVDLSPAMLEITRRKVSRLSPDIQRNITLIESDMRNLSLDQRFNLIVIPFSTFMFLHSNDDQKMALHQLHKHLSNEGRLIFAISDPVIESISESTKAFSPLMKFLEFTRSGSGRKVVSWYSQKCDPFRQLQEITFIFDELGDSGTVCQRTYSSLTLRWSYRFEIENLLELCGFEIESIFGDFSRSPFQYGGEQIWVTKRH